MIIQNYIKNNKAIQIILESKDYQELDKLYLAIPDKESLPENKYNEHKKLIIKNYVDSKIKEKDLDLKYSFSHIDKGIIFYSEIIAKI